MARIHTVYCTPTWETACNYSGNVAETRLGSGPGGFVVLECHPNLEKRIGKIPPRRNKQGDLVNEQWLFHPQGLVVHKFHFVCTQPPWDPEVLAQWERDADENTSTLSGKLRRKLANKLRRAKDLFTDVNIVLPEKRRQRRRLGCKYGSVALSLKRALQKKRPVRRRIATKAHTTVSD